MPQPRPTLQELHLCTRNLLEAAFTDSSPTRAGIDLGSAAAGETGFGNFIAADIPPAKPATPASIQSTLASVASPRSYAAPSRACSSSFPAVSALRRRGHH